MAETHYMGIELANPGQETLESIANKFNEFARNVDSANHSPGRGNKVPTAGLDINQDLNFNDAGIIRSAFLNLTGRTTLSSRDVPNVSIFERDNDVIFKQRDGIERVLGAGGATTNISAILSDFYILEGVLGQTLNSGNPTWTSPEYAPKAMQTLLKYENQWAVSTSVCLVDESFTGTASLKVEWIFRDTEERVEDLVQSETVALPLTDPSRPNLNIDWPSFLLSNRVHTQGHYDRVKVRLTWLSGNDITLERHSSGGDTSTGLVVNLIPIGNVASWAMEGEDPPSGGGTAKSAYSYRFPCATNKTGVSSSQTIPDTGDGYIYNLVANKETPAGVKFDEDFITEWEGFVIIEASKNTNMEVSLRTTHKLGENKDKTLIHERKAFFDLTAGTRRSIPLNIFNSRSVVSIGTYRGLSITAEDAKHPADIQYDLVFKSFNRKSSSIRLANSLSSLIVSDTAESLSYQLRQAVEIGKGDKGDKGDPGGGGQGLTYIKGTDDLNNLTDPGVYIGITSDNTKNKPSPLPRLEVYILYVFSQGGADRTQEIYPLSGISSFTRFSNDGNFATLSAWTKEDKITDGTIAKDKLVSSLIVEINSHITQAVGDAKYATLTDVMTLRTAIGNFITQAQGDARYALKGEGGGTTPTTSGTTPEGRARGALWATSPTLPTSGITKDNAIDLGADWTTTDDAPRDMDTTSDHQTLFGFPAGLDDGTEAFGRSLKPSQLGFWAVAKVAGVEVGAAFVPQAVDTDQICLFFSGDASSTSQFVRLNYYAFHGGRGVQLTGESTTLPADCTVELYEAVVRGERGQDGETLLADGTRGRYKARTGFLRRRLGDRDKTGRKFNTELSQWNKYKVSIWA